ncbi:MAG: hypothetical protein ABW318_16605 [Vicinamibacterales bacterium]
MVMVRWLWPPAADATDPLVVADPAELGVLGALALTPAVDDEGRVGDVLESPQPRTTKEQSPSTTTSEQRRVNMMKTSSEQREAMAAPEIVERLAADHDVVGDADRRRAYDACR